MSDKVSKPKSSKAELLKRVRIVQDWILSDYSYGDIIRSAVSRFEVSERQAERYYSQAYQDFKEASALSIDAKKAFYLQKKKKLIREMDPEMKKTPSGVRAINQVLDSMAQLDGVVIQKIEITGKDGLPIQTENKTKIDLGGLSLEQLKLVQQLKKSMKPKE